MSSRIDTDGEYDAAWAHITIGDKYQMDIEGQYKMLTRFDQIITDTPLAT
jgi:hypothetical protein